MSGRAGVFRAVVKSGELSRHGTGSTVALFLECGHVTQRSSSAAGGRALCEQCTREREQARKAEGKAPSWRVALRNIIRKQGADAVLEELAAFEAAPDVAPARPLPPMTKLDDAKVLEIRKRLASGARQEELALQFGVSFSTIYNIATGRSWTHVQLPSSESVPRPSFSREAAR